MTNLSRSFSFDKFFVMHGFSSWYVRSRPKAYKNDLNVPAQAKNTLRYVQRPKIIFGCTYQDHVLLRRFWNLLVSTAVHILRIAKMIIRETSTAKSRNHTDVRRIYPIDIPIGDIIVSILR